MARYSSEFYKRKLSNAQDAVLYSNWCKFLDSKSICRKWQMFFAGICKTKKLLYVSKIYRNVQQLFSVSSDLMHFSVNNHTRGAVTGSCISCFIMLWFDNEEMTAILWIMGMVPIVAVVVAPLAPFLQIVFVSYQFRMQQRGILVREGNNRSGSWIINDEVLFDR